MKKKGLEGPLLDEKFVENEADQTENINMTLWIFIVSSVDKKVRENLSHLVEDGAKCWKEL